jgi:hypothetical protein
MTKRWLIALLLILILIPCMAAFYGKLYVKGYYPFIFNQIDIYKTHGGSNFTKQKPYLVQKFGTTSSKQVLMEEEKVIVSTSIGENELYPDVIMSMNSYFEGIITKVYHQSLTAQVNTATAQSTAQTGGLIKDITIDLPNIAIPKTIRKILGNKAGRLNLDGTQKVTLGGSSTKRKRIPIYETNRGARFDLKMQQDTNLRLSGTIGEKIAVNLKYNSNQDETLFDPNNINIKYTGDEDEIIQSIEAGNISLALSGSRYISYSTSSQGLFGITSKWKIGSLDMTMIASTEEGQKNTQTYIGQSQADSTIIQSKNYANRSFYYIERPQDLFALYSQADYDAAIASNKDTAPGWINNLIKLNAIGGWIPLNTDLLPKNGTMKVYLDDGITTNNVASVPGDSIKADIYDIDQSYKPFYDELIEGTDFVTHYDTGIIEILKTVERRATIAVRYENELGDVPANSNILDGVLHVKPLRVQNQSYNPNNPNSLWDYQMRNIYSMGITDIKSDGFSLDVYTENEDRTRNSYVPSTLTSKQMTFNRYLNLDTSGNGIVSGEDTTINLASGFIIIPMINPFYPLGDTLLYNQDAEFISYEDFKHYISVKGKIGRDMISLGQTGVLKGSVKVKVDGKTQKENTDYLVDYDMGQITFLTTAGKNPDAKIEIDYEFRNGFAVSKKSLAGIRADWNITDNSKIGGTIIYRSESAAEKRPKIGNENMSLFLADIDGSSTWKPGFITRWIDALPLIKTNAESRIALSGEVALTMPNITGDTNNKDAAYIDDMEGILDTYPFGVSYSTWVMGSRPLNTSLPEGRINWYNVQNKTMQDVYGPENLTDDERDDGISILAMKLFPTGIAQPGMHSWYHGGIMKYLGNQLDFSNKKYIELLVKVDNAVSADANVTLHVDLGDINEDFYTEYGGLNVLNTEDADSDGSLTRYGDINEDTGLDGILDNNPGDDPNDNAIAETNPDDAGDYPHRNGTEGNENLDTEDLDNNGVLNTLDRYYSYAVSLTDNNVLTNPYLISITSKGYMLIRIPLNQEGDPDIVNNATSGILPTLKKISYVRLWAETDDTTRVLIANSSVVGNKWQDFFIRNQYGTIIPESNLAANNEYMLSGIADNQKSNHYASPKGTYTKEMGTATLEQALTLETSNLQINHQALLRQRLYEAYNLLSYRKIKFWVYPENGITTPFVAGKNLDVIFRMGADSLNYYEIRRKLPIIPYVTANGDSMQQSLWTSVEYDMSSFTSLLKENASLIDVTIAMGDTTFILKGRPTLTNIREFVFGIYNPEESSQPYTGITYFNDIRVTEPYEDIGIAGRLTLNTAMADFITLDVDYENKSENFNPNIQRGRTQTTSFSTNTSLNITNKFFLNKFFPAGWGLDMPLTLNRNYSLGIPRFRANSDILRSTAVDSIRKREKSEQITYSADLGLSQRTLPKSPWLAYTLSKMSVSGNVSNAIRLNPTRADSTLSWRGTYNYNVNLPENLLSLAVYKAYKIGFIPKVYSNSFTINATEPRSWDWIVRDTLQFWGETPQIVNTKLFTSDNGITWALTSDINTTFRLTTKRDLMQKNYYKNLNIGKETEYSQDLGLNFNPAYFPRLFTLTNSFSARYMENQRKTSQNNGAEIIDTYTRDGNSNRTIRANLTLMNATLLAGWAESLAAAHQDSTSFSPEGKAPKGKDKAPQDKQPEDIRTPEEIEKAAKENPQILEQNPDPAKEDKKQKPDNDAEVVNPTLPLSDAETGSPILPEEFDLEQDLAEGDSLGIQQPPAKAKNFVYLPSRLVGYISRIKNLTGSYQNAYTQIFTAKTVRPDFGFQVGLPNRYISGFLDSKTDENTYNVSSGIVFSRRIDSTIGYSYALSKRFSSASNQTVSKTFPDVSLTVSELDTWLGISKYLSNARFNTSYQYVVRQSGDVDWVTPKQETLTQNFNPLASLSANIIKEVQTTLSLNLSQSDNITYMDDYEIIRSTQTQGVSANISYAYSEGKGFTIPIVNKKINIRNELTSTLAIQYEKNYNKTKGRESTQIDLSTTRFTLTPTLSYQFDQNIKGGLTGGYEVNSDQKRDDGTRIFRLGIWVEINL